MTAQSLHISQILIDHCQRIAEGIVTKQYARQPELWQHVGSTGWNPNVRDAGDHLSYLAEALRAGDLSFSLRHTHHRDARVTLSEHQLRIAVRDQDPGIPRQEQHTLFEPFG